MDCVRCERALADHEIRLQLDEDMYCKGCLKAMLRVLAEMRSPKEVARATAAVLEGITRNPAPGGAAFSGVGYHVGPATIYPSK